MHFFGVNFIGPGEVKVRNVPFTVTHYSLFSVHFGENTTKL